MILKGESIKELLEIGKIEIEPFDKELQLQESSIDMRLSERIYRYPEELEAVTMLDIKNPYLNIVERDFVSDEGFVLKPGESVVAETLEYIKVPDYLNTFLDSKFRLDRYGLLVLNKGWLGTGFEGFISVVLHNSGNYPIRLFKGERFCQLTFVKVE